METTNAYNKRNTFMLTLRHELIENRKALLLGLA